MRITPALACAVVGLVSVALRGAEGDVKSAGAAGTPKSRVFSVADFGAVGDDKTDNTSAFAAGIQAAIAAGGGRLFIPDGVYRGRIEIPPFTRKVSSWITIEIVGESEPTPVFGTIGAFPLGNTGTIIRALNASGPAVVSVARGAANSAYGDFSPVYVVMRNLEVRTQDDPGIGGVDLRHAVQARLENVFINTGVYNVQASKPTHVTTGLVTPACNNGALTILANVVVCGYHTGIEVNEHTDGQNIVVASNVYGLQFPFAHHASHFGRVGAYRNTHHLAVTGRHGFVIEQLNTEHPGPGQTDEKNAWQSLVSDLHDPGNLGTGELRYWTVRGNVGAIEQFISTGGASIQARRIGTAARSAGKSDR